MTTFDKREEAYENRFAHDEDLAFRARARATRKLGLWAAEHLDKAGADGEAYAEAFLAAEVSGPDGEGPVARVAADLAAAGVTPHENQIRHRWEELLAEARQDVMR